MEKQNRLGGILFGFVFAVLLASPSRAQTGSVDSASPQVILTTLVAFNGPNGLFPSSVGLGTDGKLWGTTSGLNSNCGNVFQLTLSGHLRVDHKFDCNTGDEPTGLTLGTDGNFYGSTFVGGRTNDGTVFKISPGTHTFTELADFNVASNGSGPLGQLVEGNDGYYYGATYGGGANFYGTLFRVTPTGLLKTLYEFDFIHGAQPYAGLVQGQDGNFYGTTYAGGAYGLGTVFRITSHGTFTVLHNFGQDTSEGFSPVTPLIQGRDGSFYGAAPDGGVNYDGTVFRISPSGTFTLLHSFAETDGRYPCGLVQANDGNLYGTTAYGGTNSGAGTLFKMTPDGVVTTLHNFDGVDGANSCFLIQITDGSFIGLTGGGGDLSCDPSYGCGTVFRLSVGLRPFVETTPVAGRVGSQVSIVGTNLNGATDVSFNGTAAAFVVVSKSEITAAVPNGATSGTVMVTAPGGTLSSNKAFRVLP